MTKHFFYENTLAVGEYTLPEEMSHRMRSVLRFKEGQEVRLFNGKDGLWEGVITHFPKRGVACVEVIKQALPQPHAVEKHLFLALAKRDAFERSVRFATELGVSHIHPLKTAFSVASKLNYARLQTIITEAAEQCERLSLPEVLPVTPLESIAADIPPILWADEGTARGNFAVEAPKKQKTIAKGVLVGPEGGFSPEEKAFLRMQKHVLPMCLGENVLRVDTAVVASLVRL